MEPFYTTLGCSPKHESQQEEQRVVLRITENDGYAWEESFVAKNVDELVAHFALTPKVHSVVVVVEDHEE